MISVKNLFHSYNKDGNYQVKDVSFEVKKGEIFGFLGPSGAGKSTTQNILTGLLVQVSKLASDDNFACRYDAVRYNRIK